MARPVSALLKSFGEMLEVTEVLVHAILDMGGSDDDLLRVRKDKRLAAEIAKLIMAERGIVVPDGFEVLTVNYALKLADVIAAGAFDWANEFVVEENFPNAEHETGKRNLAVKLYHFSHIMSADDIVKAMDEEGCRPATAREALAFAQKNPTEQHKYPIVALGSVWEELDDCNVLCLGILDGRECGLYLLQRNDSWGGRHRFLAVHRS